jgi:hypothetical protein
MTHSSSTREATSRMAEAAAVVSASVSELVSAFRRNTDR